MPRGQTIAEQHTYRAAVTEHNRPTVFPTWGASSSPLSPLTPTSLRENRVLLQLFETQRAALGHPCSPVLQNKNVTGADRQRAPAFSPCFPVPSKVPHLRNLALGTNRNVAAEAPRDRSIALIAPAAAALLLTLPRFGFTSMADGGSGGGGGSNSSGLRALLFGILADCMRGAVDLMAMVLDGATKLGHTVKPERCACT